jgi:hypothetical protein
MPFNQQLFCKWLERKPAFLLKYGAFRLIIVAEDMPSETSSGFL